MPKSYPFFVVNAFAEEPFGGNPAGVFPSAESLSDIQMQAIAKQLNLVETVFVTQSTSEDADFQLRYFTPHKELPIAGHPTIATWVGLVLTNKIDLSKKEFFYQQTKLGIQEIQITKSDSGVLVWMQQPKPKFIGIVDSHAEVASIFGIETQEMLPDLPVEAIDTGLGHIVFGVRSLKSLMKIRRNISQLKNLCSHHGVSEAQIFCMETYNSSLNLHTRNICPREGIEDPACGVGNSALLSYLMKNKIYNEPSLEIRVEQGHIENMPSVIWLRGSRDHSENFVISIGGSGLIMVQGEFTL